MAAHVYRNRSTRQVVVFDGPHARLDKSDRWAKLTGEDASKFKDAPEQPTPANRAKAADSKPSS